MRANPSNSSTYTRSSSPGRRPTEGAAARASTAIMASFQRTGMHWTLAISPRAWTVASPSTITPSCQALATRGTSAAGTCLPTSSSR